MASPRRHLRHEVALVVLVAAAVLVPGIWRYSLVDPWETHYGEVGRMMLEKHDFVHTQWPQENEGFRSKPVLTFWMMAAGMRAVGVAEDGGYSGEMVDTPRVMLGIRLPFCLAAIAGLTLLWWMLARLVSRRLAWLALLVVGSSPFVCLVARQSLPDTPLLACIVGALALFVLANEDGDRPIAPIGHLRIPWTHRRLAIDPRHVLFAIAGGFVAVQAIYYFLYFMWSPQLAVTTWVRPVYLSIAMGALLVAQSRDGWLIVRLPVIAIGGVLVELRGRAPHVQLPGQSLWRYTFDVIIPAWERQSPDRYLVRALTFPFVWAYGGSWATTDAVADRVLAMRPLATMRQVYLLWCYALVGISVLAKGPPGLAVVAGVIGMHTLVLWRWRAMFDGALEIKRGVLLAVAIFVPWHVAMWLKDGPRFISEYLVMHILNRATVGVDSSPGTFEYYTSQIGHGMWLWAALLPAAFAAAILRARVDTRAGRVRFTITLWALVAVAFYSLVQTKFHHYILPAIPPLAILVAWFLDDLVARRERLHPVFAAVGAGIALLVGRDLAFEPDRWIEMFVYRYDRPWPHGEPWSIDPSDAFVVLAIVAALAIGLAATRWVRCGVAALGVVGLAICIWSLQVYMPIAAIHWGMRGAIRTYYEQRTIYGHETIYFGIGQLADEWRDHGDVVRFETAIPDALQVGQPMTITLQVNAIDDETTRESDYTLLGSVTAIDDHAVEVTLRKHERGRLAGAIERGRTAPRSTKKPIRMVDADRLLAWQLYWRGENFWTADEIWGWAPEMKTAFMKPDNVEFLKYLADRQRAPLGRRYFLVTEANKIPNVRPSLPTRAKATFEVIDTSSNKFTLAAFWL